MLPFGQSRNAVTICLPSGPVRPLGTGGLPCSTGGCFGVVCVSSTSPTTIRAAATAAIAPFRIWLARGDTAELRVPGMPRAATIVFEAMATYRELLRQVKDRIVEIDAREAQELAGAAWIDVREQDEWDEGHIPGAAHIPRGNLESRIEGVVPDRSTPVVIYCASGSRSAFAADSL